MGTAVENRRAATVMNMKSGGMSWKSSEIRNSGDDPSPVCEPYVGRRKDMLVCSMVAVASPWENSLALQK